jgi:hypothetical protein
MRRRKQQIEDETPAGHSGPPEAFCAWWYPHSTQEPSGASVGGHPDADRVWARKDPGRWRRRRFGITATLAWTAQYYRDQYERWIDAGQPIEPPFVSLAATPERQAEFWRGMTAQLRNMGKPVPQTDDDAIEF